VSARNVKPIPKSSGKAFQARLERSNNRLNWVIVRIPFDVAKIWGTRGQLRVKGAINGFAFRTSLFPMGNGDHVMLVNKRMQAGAGTGVGAVAQFRLEPDTEERVITVPPELARSLSEDRSLRRWFDRFNDSARRWMVDWVTQVKSAQARERRANQMAERLLSAMEAERELPPILRDAFARNGRAYEGWKRMSPSHRRGHLLGIFSYRDPDSRARRVAKVVEDAEAFAERGGKRSQRRSSVKA
jgi:uncharacterized protein YdeI (YjbR/CyaY-like superfamily)